MTKYGDYITLFNLDHIIYIIGLIVIGAALFIKKDAVNEHRRTITVVILIVSIIQQILLYSSYYFILDFDLGESLPLQISRVNTILGIIFLITKNDKVFRVLALFGLFAWLSFLYPSRVYGITHPIGWSFFINHVVTLLLPFYGIIAYNMKIKTMDSLKVFPWFVLYVAVAYFVNMLTDGNYFYLKHKPIFADLHDVFYIPISLLFTYVLFAAGEWVYKKVQKTLQAPSS